MPRPTMRRLAATVLVSASLTGGNAAGSGAASAAPANQLLSAESVAAGPAGFVDGGDIASRLDLLVSTVGYKLLVATGSASPCGHFECNQ